MADTADLLFELGTEELPPVALKRLSDALQSEFVAGLDKIGLQYGEVQAYAAPRRLALYICDMAVGQPDRDIERRGPAVQAAFDGDGNPTKAAEGFARSCGTTVDQLQRLKTDKGEWLAYTISEKGKAASELLPGIAEQALNRLPIPKRMRWGSSDAEFVRPVHWLVFLLGDEVVPCTLLEAEAGRNSFGHRFHAPQAITIGSPSSYASQLREEGKVIVDFAERRETIRSQVEKTAADLGGRAEIDEELLDEVTALVEWPVPISAGFESEFLAVPHEALILTMKKNQKYFHLVDADGKLMPHFITLSNIDSSNPQVIAEGNARVVRPRLADAKFFWEQDAKKRLEDHQDSLKKVVFQKQLGSLYDKSERTAGLAHTIAAQIGGDAELAKRAGLLSKCDLMTEMVYEFPEMQGIMGRYQAQRDNEPAELGQAMDEIYMPRFAGDELPATATGQAIALADRIDTLVGIFGIGQKPTGDKDPFGLRRAALGVLRIMVEDALPLDLKALLAQAAEQLGERLSNAEAANEVYDFMLDRLKGYYSDQGVSLDSFDAVAALRPVSPMDFDKRVRAVSTFRDLAEAEALAAANKRIGNILKKADGDVPEAVEEALFEGDAERVLAEQISSIRSDVEPLLNAADYEAALKTLAGLRDATDRFFDDVMVMAEDPKIRANRLALLAGMSRLFLGVADIGRLQVK